MSDCGGGGGGGVAVARVTGKEKVDRAAASAQYFPPSAVCTRQRSSFETERVPPSVTPCPHGLGEDAPRTDVMWDVFAHDDDDWRVRVSHVFPFNRTAISIVAL